MLFVAFEGCHSIREVVLGLLANANKLAHLGLSYIVRLTTFSEANQQRSSKVFGEIYMDVYKSYVYKIIMQSNISLPSLNQFIKSYYR